MLKVQNLSKSYGNTAVLKNVSFSAPSGKTLGIIGTNGAGKSTLVNILTAVEKASGGTAVFDGVDLLKLSVYSLKKHGIARSFQTPRLFSSLTVSENFALAGLHENNPTLAFELDYATARTLEIRRAVSLRPKLLFLDELSAGMISKDAHALASEVRSLNATIVMIEHNLSLVREFCDFTLALCDGEVLAFGQTGEVLGDKAVREKLMGE